MSDYRQSYSADVNGSVADCFAVLTEFEAYPEWSGPIKKCVVLERHPDRLARTVAFELDMLGLKTVRYTLEYHYEPPKGGHWSLVEGDPKNIQGSYTFEDRGGGRTKATCTQEVDIGFWVPGPLRRVVEQRALRESVEDFKKAVEARVRQGRGSPA